MAAGDLRQTDFDVIHRGYNIPTGSFVTTPTVFAEDIGHVWLEEVTLETTPQVAGKAGFRLRLAGGIILPEGGENVFVGGFGAFRTFAVGIEVDSGLQVEGVNFGNFPHFILVGYKTRLINPQVDNANRVASTTANVASGAPVAVPAPVPITTVPPPITGGPPVSTLELRQPSTAVPTDPLAALQQAVADLQARVTALESEVASLQGTGAPPSSSATAAGGTQPAPAPSGAGGPGAPNPTPGQAGNKNYISNINANVLGLATVRPNIDTNTTVNIPGVSSPVPISILHPVTGTTSSTITPAELVGIAAQAAAIQQAAAQQGPSYNPPGTGGKPSYYYT